MMILVSDEVQSDGTRVENSRDRWCLRHCAVGYVGCSHQALSVVIKYTDASLVPVVFIQRLNYQYIMAVTSSMCGPFFSPSDSQNLELYIINYEWAP